jgi:hypothetical protein
VSVLLPKAVKQNQIIDADILAILSSPLFVMIVISVDLSRGPRSTSFKIFIATKTLHSNCRKSIDEQ